VAKVPLSNAVYCTDHMCTARCKTVLTSVVPAQCRYRQSVVNDVLQRSKAIKSNNPVNVWKGSFRDEAPIDRHHKPWKPNGLAASLYNTGSCGLMTTA